MSEEGSEVERPAGPEPLAKPNDPERELRPAPARAGHPLLPEDPHPWRTLLHSLSAKWQHTSRNMARRLTKRTLKIGVSARIFHPQPGAKGLPSKNLQYLEESISNWIMSRDVMVFMIPSVNTNGLIRTNQIRLRDYAKHLDGLVLQGGADIAPESYAQAATCPEWQGDRMRDMYELELLNEFIEADKPLLGICRGCQLVHIRVEAAVGRLD